MEEKITASSGPDPNRLPPHSLTSNSKTGETNKKKKFDLRELEICILLASIAMLGLTTLTLITLSMRKVQKSQLHYAKKYPEIYQI